MASAGAGSGGARAVVHLSSPVATSLTAASAATASDAKGAADGAAADDLLGGFESAAWSVPLLRYIDAHASLYSSSAVGSGRPEHARLHADFKALVEARLGAQLAGAGLSPAAFLALLDRARGPRAARVLAQLQAVDDYETFAEMMRLRCAELEAAALAEAEAGGAAGGSGDSDRDSDDVASAVQASLVEAAAARRLAAYEAQELNQALAVSAAEASAAAAAAAVAAAASAEAAISLATSPPMHRLPSLPPLPHQAPAVWRGADDMAAAAAGAPARAAAAARPPDGDAAEIERRAAHFSSLRSLLAARRQTVAQAPASAPAPSATDPATLRR